MRDSRSHPRKKASEARKTSLRDEVRDALLVVLRDGTASPTARAIAGRSLMQMISEGGSGDEQAPALELSIEELDEEIAKLSANPQQGR